MSHSNVTKEMSGADVNSEGKPYHEHGDKIEKKKHEVSHDPDAKYPAPHHGHDNQFHKDLKGSIGSGSAIEKGDR
ncbi:unnamed protein product, partial [Adineta steineri]